MKASEFYEKYWKIDYGDGKLVSPPKLSEEEKVFLDSCAENKNCQEALFIRKRKRRVQVNVQVLKEQMDKLPKYFMPSNQPVLDKYGNIQKEIDELTPP